MSDQTDKVQRSLNALRTNTSREDSRADRPGGRRESGVIEARPVLAALQSARPSLRSAVTVNLETLGAAALLVDAHGTVLARNQAADALLCAAGVSVLGNTAFRLPAELWAAVCATPLGQSADWRAAREIGGLSFSRLGAGQQRYVLILRELNTRGEDLARRLHRQRLEITGRLVAMIAHDLRVPLSSILFNADAGLERPLKEDEVGLVLRDIRAAADTIRASIDALLDFACLGGAQSTSVDLCAVVGRVKSLLRPTMRDGGHRLQVDLESGAQFVCGNALMIEQILVNLVLNAMQVTDQPVSIELTSSRTSVHVAPEVMQSYGVGHVISLAVQDDGPGVPPALRDQVFEPFFTTKESGIGLGLPMAREASSSMGAALTLEHSLRGARFVLWLREAESGEAQRR